MLLDKIAAQISNSYLTRKKNALKVEDGLDVEGNTKVEVEEAFLFVWFESHPGEYFKHGHFEGMGAISCGWVLERF